MTRLVALLVIVWAIGAAGDSTAQTSGTSVVRLPNEIVYKGLPGAPQHVTLFGDPTNPGLYVDRIKFSAGTKVMPHWHPDPVRTVLVLSGTLYFAVGEVFDEAKLTPYPAGTLYSEPPGTRHFAWAKDGEVILQITAIGPMGIRLFLQSKSRNSAPLTRGTQAPKGDGAVNDGL
jgi:quercetin dioxygenase-like cupin family protein